MHQSADLINAVDWDRHPLGPRQAWPTALKILTNTMLNSPESMYLVWGDERVFLFNDAYIPILGPRLPAAMGARFEDLWADAWPSVEPLFLKAEAGQSTRLVDLLVPMARFGVPEDTWWTFSYTPVRDETGAVAGVLCITNETTDRVVGEAARAKAVARQDMLNHELSHRVKNTISMVQAIAAQSLRRIDDQDTIRAFEDRLVALGHAHNVLLDSQWQPASVRSVIKPMLDLYNGRDQFIVEGPEVLLASTATLSLSLLLHELATNAAKYGALSTETGQVRIDWNIIDAPSGDRFVIRWRESGGPLLTPPTRKGFGSRLIAMGLCGSRDTDLEYRPTGLEARFAASLERLALD